MPGWVNVDLYADDADVKCDASNMPFRGRVFDRVYMGHFLEHIELFSIPEILYEVARVCHPGSKVVVVGPCIEKARETKQPKWLLDQIKRSPSPDQPGAGHAWTPTTELTMIALEYCGFEPVEIPVGSVMRPEWPNTVPDAWQFAIAARTPEA